MERRLTKEQDDQAHAAAKQWALAPIGWDMQDETERNEIASQRLAALDKAVTDLVTAYFSELEIRLARMEAAGVPRDVRKEYFAGCKPTFSYDDHTDTLRLSIATPKISPLDPAGTPEQA